MGKEVIDSVVGIVTAIIGLAVLSVLLSGNAKTTGVIGALSKGLSQDISAATSPVTMSGGFGGTSGFGYPTVGESYGGGP